MNRQPLTFGIIIGNRGFFPTALCEQGRAEILAAVAKAGHKAVVLTGEDSAFGSVESLADARKCADLFDRHRREIAGIIVTLPNFGDEQGVANAIRWSGLDVPVLVQATPDEPGQMTAAGRRDSFCGKISVCNNLKQYGIPFSLTTLHTDRVTGPTFAADLGTFAATCRVVRKLRNLRVGAIGARPTAFNTVRYSEKLLEESGISVTTLDLFELFGRVGQMADGEPAVQEKLAAIAAYVATGGVPPAALLKMAKLGATIDRWMADNELAASAIQCWTAMEEFFGVVPCTCMSLMSDRLLPSACEVDIMGAVAMVALNAASGSPSAIVDWNNNYGDDPDRGVFFHCSNLPKSVFAAGAAGGCPATMHFQEIIAGTLGQERTFGTVYGRLRPGPFTFLRAGTEDAEGVIRAYVGEGEITADPLDTFGGYGVFRVDDLQGLLRFICENGFEHHVSLNLAATADAIEEALGNYLGWEVYRHE